MCIMLQVLNNYPQMLLDLLRSTFKKVSLDERGRGRFYLFPVLTSYSFLKKNLAIGKMPQVLRGIKPVTN